MSVVCLCKSSSVLRVSSKVVLMYRTTKAKEEARVCLCAYSFKLAAENVMSCLCFFFYLSIHYQSVVFHGSSALRMA